MATSSRNLNYRICDTYSFPVDSTASFNEGDLMYWDTSAHLAKPISDKAHVPYLLGNSLSQNPVTYNGTISSTAIAIGPKHRTVKLIAREATTVYTGTPVYYHTDAQSFGTTNNSGDDALGVIMVDPKEYGTTGGITLVVGKEYEIRLRESYVLTL